MYSCTLALAYVAKAYEQPTIPQSQCLSVTLAHASRAHEKSAICRENQLHMQQQQVQKDTIAMQQQKQLLSKDRIALQAERSCLPHQAAPLADITWSYNQQHRSLADLLASLHQESSSI